MVVIGLIGSPAGGKSTVAKRLGELGAAWIDADRIARRCLALSEVRRQLQGRFGPGVLDAAGRVDRRALADRVFGDDAESTQALDYLESVLHPQARRVVLRRMLRAARRGISVAVLDAPLLLEADWGVLCDFIWCVDAPVHLRKQWIAKRGWTIEELRRRERRQLEIQEKRRLSTHVIENTGSRDQLLHYTELLWGALTQATTTSSMPLALADPLHCT